MADTIRSTDDLLNASTGLFKDNTAGDISAQDLRDFVLSTYRPQSVNCCARLSLDPTNRVVPGITIVAPDSTDTSADTITVTAGHGYCSGTMVTVSATGGGLTAGTTYYVNAVSTTALSFHTTLAAAMAGTSKVDLTASITAQIQYLGIASSTLYLHPVNGNSIGLYDGTSWKIHVVNSQSLALSGLTADTLYDVFAYDNAGTLTLELTAWTSSTARATAIDFQDGVLVKSGAATRRYLGTIRAISTTDTEASLYKQFLWNHYNQRILHAVRSAGSSSHTYNSSTYRNYNNSATSTLVEWVIGSISAMVMGSYYAIGYQSVAGDQRMRLTMYHGGLSGTIRFNVADELLDSSTSSTSRTQVVQQRVCPVGYWAAIVMEAANGGTLSVDFGQSFVAFMG